MTAAESARRIGLVSLLAIVLGACGVGRSNQIAAMTPAYAQCRAQLAGAALASGAIVAATPRPRQPRCSSVVTASGSATTCY